MAKNPETTAVPTTPDQNGVGRAFKILERVIGAVDDGKPLDGSEVAILHTLFAAHGIKLGDIVMSGLENGQVHKTALAQNEELRDQIEQLKREVTRLKQGTRMQRFARWREEMRKNMSAALSLNSSDDNSFVKGNVLFLPFRALGAASRVAHDVVIGTLDAAIPLPRNGNDALWPLLARMPLFPWIAVHYHEKAPDYMKTRLASFEALSIDSWGFYGFITAVGLVTDGVLGSAAYYVPSMPYNIYSYVQHKREQSKIDNETQGKVLRAASDPFNQQVDAFFTKNKPSKEMSEDGVWFQLPRGTSDGDTLYLRLRYETNPSQYIIAPPRNDSGTPTLATVFKISCYNAREVQESFVRRADGTNTTLLGGEKDAAEDLRKSAGRCITSDGRVLPYSSDPKWPVEPAVPKAP